MPATLAYFVALVSGVATLPNLPTTVIPVGSVIKFIESTTSAEVAYQLQANGTGVLPADYSATANNKSWHYV